MTSIESKNNMREARIRVAACIVTIMLSVDQLKYVNREVINSKIYFVYLRIFLIIVNYKLQSYQSSL